jgi:signal transduction histidine kinase/ActR/RegA family two-component response regulator
MFRAGGSVNSRPTLSLVRLSRLRQWWLDRSVLVKGMIVVSIPLAALLAITSASLVLQASEQQERRVGTAASNLSTSANRVLADAVNAESGVRGYVATGESLFLRPYNVTVTRLGHELTVLRAAARAAGYSRRERVVEATAAEAMAELGQMRSATARGVPAAAQRSALDNGMKTMDVFRGDVAGLVSGPSAVLAARRADINRMETEIDTLTIVGLALGIVAGVIGVSLFTSGISRRLVLAAANADRLGEGKPLKPVADAADELGRLSGALVEAEALLISRADELIATRDEAVRATKAKNVFLSSTSHELRTPLNSVLGFTQLLQLSELSEEDRDSVERILGAGRHLLALINELIDISRIESGEFSLSVEPVLVHPVVEEACRLMAPLAAQRSIVISQHCPHPDLAVHADRQRLSQILVNLASNAIKYNREGGTITITCQPEGPGHVSLAVADTGPGMVAADLERIFTPFERLGAEQTGIEGTGIGLPLARAFAQAMSGRLTATSEPGTGATFTLTLPRSTDIAGIAPAGAPAAALPGGPAPAETGTHVLYIEDNPANIEVVTRFLRTKPSVRLQSARSGRSGLDLARREVPDLLLLDLHLPDLSGDEVLRQLRADPATADLPVAILSAEASPDIIRRMRARGVTTYLTKPLDLAELGRLVDSFVERRERPAGQAPRTTSA